MNSGAAERYMRGAFIFDGVVVSHPILFSNWSEKAHGRCRRLARSPGAPRKPARGDGEGREIEGAITLMGFGMVS